MIPNFNEADLPILTKVVEAASGIIERYCNRKFAVTNYTELLDGTGHPNIMLSAYAVVTLERMMFNPTQVVFLGNLKQGVSRASFRLDAQNLYLETVDQGVQVNRVIPRASCQTLEDLAAAVRGYSSDGWYCNALGIYGQFATADLYSPQGGHEVRWSGYGYLWLHTFGTPASMQNTAIGEVVSPFIFQRGYQNYYCKYSAGFDPIPPEIEQACADLSAQEYLQRFQNTGLKSETIGEYSYTRMEPGHNGWDNLGTPSKYAIEQYRNWRVPKYRIA